MIGARLSHFSLEDLLQPENLANPYPYFKQLRSVEPVCESNDGRGWIVSRYDDIVAVLTDRRFSAERIVKSSGEKSPDSLSSEAEQALARMMLFLDPPDHTRLRTLFTKAFTPHRVEALRPHVTGIVKGMLDRAEDAGGQIDFIHEIAVPFPVIVIAQMLGVPPEDRDNLKTWSLGFGRLLGGRALTPEEASEARAGIMAFVQYFLALIAERKQHPREDMLSDLIQVEEVGERLNLQELIVNLILLLAAGHGTTTHLLGNGLLALSSNHDQWNELVAELDSDPSNLPNAVNELLRFDGPVQATTRLTLEEVSLAGKTIAPNQRVTLLLGSANHDEAYFEDPDILNLRRPAVRPLSFGHGIHTCLGAALARMESQVVFGELARRFPNFAVTIKEPQHLPSIHFRGLHSLPISLNG